MRVGVHVSIAGGLDKGLQRAVKIGCDTAQLFLTNPRGWKMTPLRDETVEAFDKAKQGEAAHVSPLVVHIPYLPNLASEDGEIFQKSVQTLRENLRRCDVLGIDYLVTHMGKGEGKRGIDRMLEGIQRACGEEEYQTCLLIENAAGQGREMGFQIPEISELYERLPKNLPKGICWDTCHAFAAGYDMSKTKGYNEVADEFNKHIGFDKVKVIHLNDSLNEMGSRVDRHAKIGEGKIGLEGFRALFRHKQFKTLPCILEVPRKSDEDDIKQLEVVRSLQANNPK